MKKIKYLTLLSFAVLLLSSCKKDQYYLYSDVGRIQFGPEPSRIYTSSFEFADTLKRVTFYYDDASVTQDTVFFDIYAIGGIKNFDRSFTIKQELVEGAENAVVGKHYVAFNDSKVSGNYVIKAGKVHTTVPIVLLRDPSLKTTTPVLKIVVEADKNFQLGEINKLWRKIEMTDRLSQPAGWNTTFTNYYLGKYSVVKHAFMINATGDKWDQDFFIYLTTDLAVINYYRTELKTALIEYNKTHPPLTDEFNEVVVFP